MRLRRRHTERGIPQREYAFSEHVTAGTLSRWHISPVGPEGLKLGGGAPPALCFAGREWWNGWHINRYVTAFDLAADRDFVCRACADEWIRRVQTVIGLNLDAKET